MQVPLIDSTESFPPELQLPTTTPGEGWHGNDYFQGGECCGWVKRYAGGRAWGWVAATPARKSHGYENSRDLACVRVTRQLEQWEREDLAAFIEQHRDECVAAFADVLVKNAGAIEAWASDKREADDFDVQYVASLESLSDRAFIADIWLDRITGPLDTDAQYIADYGHEAVEQVKAKHE